MPLIMYSHLNQPSRMRNQRVISIRKATPDPQHGPNWSSNQGPHRLKLSAVPGACPERSRRVAARVRITRDLPIRRTKRHPLRRCFAACLAAGPHSVRIGQRLDSEHVVGLYTRVVTAHKNAQQSAGKPVEEPWVQRSEGVIVAPNLAICKHDQGQIAR